MIVEHMGRFFDFREAKRLNHINPDYPLPEDPVEITIVEEVNFEELGESDF